MLAVTQLADQSVSSTLYEDLLLLQNLAMQLRTDACTAAAPGCNARRELLPDRTKDPVFWTQLSELYKKVAVAIGDTEAASRDLALLPPLGASNFALDMAGKLAKSGDQWVVRGSTTPSPGVVDWLNRGVSPSTTKTPWGTIALVSALALSAGAGIGILLARRVS